MTLKKKAFDKGIFAIPYAVICVIFVVFPLVLLLFYAFRGSDGSFTFSNFGYVLGTGTYWLVLLETIGTAALTTAICLVLAYPVAYVLAQSPFNKHAVLSLLFIVPMWMNFLLRIFALNSLLDMIGIGRGYLSALIGLVYDFFPFMLLPIYTVLANMDKSYKEASRDLGAGEVKTFLRVTLPLSLSGISSGVMMVFMPAFSAYAITNAMGDSTTSLIGNTINIFISNRQVGYGSALSFVLLALVIIVMVVGSFLQNRKSKAESNTLTRGGGII